MSSQEPPEIEPVADDGSLVELSGEGRSVRADFNMMIAREPDADGRFQTAALMGSAGSNSRRRSAGMTAPC